MSMSVSLYKDFIDGLVEVVRGPSSMAARLRTGGNLYDHPEGDQDRFNHLAAELSPKQRDVVAELLQGERQSSVGDVLAFMAWKQYRVSLQGEQLAVEPFGTESFYDLICRIEGDPWPDHSQAE